MPHHLAVCDCNAADRVSRYAREELGKPSVRQADKVIVTGQITEDLMRMPEAGIGPVTIILAKEKDADLSQGEYMMIERLLKHQIRVQIMRGGRASRVV